MSGFTDRIIASMAGGLVVSCQAYPGEPLHHQRVKPATATRTLSRDTVLTTFTAQPLTIIVTELGRERTFTNASGVRLSDANNAVDASRSDA